MMELDDTIRDVLLERLTAVEKHFDSDVIFYYGEIHPTIEKFFRDFIESLSAHKDKRESVTVFINTPGGSVETVEKMVDILRYHYPTVHYVVPDYAMSAGTILCMSGDKIFMDYTSSLGPIDPQVFNGKEYVPALGYLDQVEKLIEKSRNNTITQAEFLMLQNLDLATLSRYEQAKKLTITLLKKWLVEYKFKDWAVHGTTPAKKGQAVTAAEKAARAEEIASALSDNKLWHSHGRFIGIKTLTGPLKLKIEDYSADLTRRKIIRGYNDVLLEHIRRQKHPNFLHHRSFF